MNPQVRLCLFAVNGEKLTFVGGIEGGGDIRRDTKGTV